MTKSILVPDRYRCVCMFCGSPAVEQHHLIYGTGNRLISDNEGLIIPLCVEHHKVWAHNVDGKHEIDSKAIQMMGQWAWMCNDLAEFVSGMSADVTRERVIEVEKDKFRNLFGRSLF